MEWLFETDQWPARWHCGVWPLWLGWGTIISNLLIALAYFLIPFMGWQLFRKKPELFYHKKLAVLCGAFVLSCGFTHLMDALTFYWPTYRFNLVARAWTAAVSLTTLAVIGREWRALLQYIGPEETKKLLAQRDDAFAKLQKMHRALVEQSSRDVRIRHELELELSQVRENAVVLESKGDDEIRLMGETIRRSLHKIRNVTGTPIAGALLEVMDSPSPPLDPAQEDAVR